MAIDLNYALSLDGLATIAGVLVAAWAIVVMFWQSSEVRRREILAFAAVAVSLAALVRDQRRQAEVHDGRGIN